MFVVDSRYRITVKIMVIICINVNHSSPALERSVINRFYRQEIECFAIES